MDFEIKCKKCGNTKVRIFVYQDKACIKCMTEGCTGDYENYDEIIDTTHDNQKVKGYENAKLVFEMPEACIDCKTSYINGQHRPGIVKVHCIPLGEDCPEYGKHEECPLIETDEEENC